MAIPSYIQAPTVMRAIAEVLKSLQYPSSTTYQGTPTVVFLPTYEETSFEEIRLLGMVEDGEADWYAADRSIEERFSATITIRTAVPGVDGLAAWDRADALAKVVQDGFRHGTTGLPAGLVSSTNLLANWRFYGFTVEDFPVPGDSGGTGVVFTLRLRVITRR